MKPAKKSPGKNATGEPFSMSASSLGIRLLTRVLLAIDRLVPRPAVLGPAGESDVIALARRQEAQTREILALFDPPPDLVGKTLLDLGCGLGGRTAYYAAQRAACVVGLEISRLRAEAAQRYIQQRGLAQTSAIVVGDATRLPFRRGSFDMIISTDTWEHLKEPEHSLAECHRVAIPRAMIFIHFMPYYSPWGAHLWDWLGIPWLQFWIPQRWLRDVMREVDRLRHVNLHRDASVRVDWYNDQDPAHTRRLTVARFEKTVGRLGAQVVQLATLPIGFRSWRSVAKLVAWLTTLPGIRELLTGLVVCVLRSKGTEVD